MIPSSKSKYPVWAGAKARCLNPDCGQNWQLGKEDLVQTFKNFGAENQSVTIINPGFKFDFAAKIVTVPCQDCGAMMTIKAADYVKSRK